jgi:hypothetical protein
MRAIVLAVALGLSTAQATAIQLRYQARLVDADGVPINPAVTSTAGIYADGQHRNSRVERTAHRHA